MTSLEFFVPSERIDKRGRPAPLPGANTLFDANRENRYGGAALKKRETYRVAAIAKAEARFHKWRRPGGKVRVVLEWHEVNRRRDQDNITAYQKPLLDGLVLAGILANDDQRHIEGCSTNTIVIDKANPGVLVRVETCEEET